METPADFICALDTLTCDAAPAAQALSGDRALSGIN
jgi:hypothetical protein